MRAFNIIGELLANMNCPTCRKASISAVKGSVKQVLKMVPDIKAEIEAEAGPGSDDAIH